jgi:hypothetical protein
MKLQDKKIIFNKKDTYSLDSVLSPIISSGLKKLLEVLKGQKSDSEDSTFGIPGGMLSADKDNYTEKELDEATAEWFLIIEKMIYAFDEKEPQLPDDVLEMVASSKPNDKGYYTMEVNILDHDAHHEFNKRNEAHKEKVDEGLELFAKYYGALWW